MRSTTTAGLQARKEVLVRKLRGFKSDVAWLTNHGQSTRFGDRERAEFILLAQALGDATGPGAATRLQKAIDVLALEQKLGRAAAPRKRRPKRREASKRS